MFLVLWIKMRFRSLYDISRYFDKEGKKRGCTSIKFTIKNKDSVYFYKGEKLEFVRRLSKKEQEEMEKFMKGQGKQGKETEELFKELDRKYQSPIETQDYFIDKEGQKQDMKIIKQETQKIKKEAEKLFDFSKRKSKYKKQIEELNRRAGLIQ